MTYLERITYLVGEFIELSQYAIKNAYRLNSYLNTKKRAEEYTTDRNIIAENKAKESYSKITNKSGSDILNDLKDSSISTKDMNKLKSLLLKRDNIINTFFIENGYALSKEDLVVYNDIIAQLEEYRDLAKEINVKFANDIAPLDW